MIDVKTKNKIKKFFQILSKTQPKSGKDFGLIIRNKETISDIVSSFPNSNLVSVYDLTKDTYVSDFLKNLAKEIEKERIILLCLHDYLSPQIYNQFHLVYKTGKMTLFEFEDNIIAKVPKKTQLILISTNEELERVNYKNLFNIVGPILRL